MEEKPNFAVLFDNDGVILDTEPQYDTFWNEQGKIFHPELPGFASYLKGFSLEKTLQIYFPEDNENRRIVVDRLNDFESNMNFEYLPGSREILDELYKKNVPTALVTSSNDLKMSKIIKNHPEFQTLFNVIITSDKVSKTKPDPECYLEAARQLNVDPKNCFVVEDSKTGIIAGKEAKCFVIGLATTNSKSEIEKLAHIAVNNLSEVSYTFLNDLWNKIK